MITIRKLSKLPPDTALRKTARLLQGFEIDLTSNIFPNNIYLRDLIDFILLSDKFSEDEIKNIKKIKLNFENRSCEILRTCNNLRHLLLKHLNEEPADWDLIPSTKAYTKNNQDIKQTKFPFKIYLDDIRSPFNIGSIFRTAESFGADRILLSPGSSSPEHKRAKRSSMGCTDIIPWENYDCSRMRGENIFALELNGTPIQHFKFPEKGIVILGSEELGVSPECLNLADKSYGRVSIPMAGSKGSINVSVAFGILMYNWYSRVV